MANQEKIKRKSRFGIRKHINSYQKEIAKTFYNEELLEEKLNNYLKKTGKENLNDAFLDYLHSLTGNINELLKKAKEYISESYEKGSKRVVDKEGNTISLDETIDENAIKVLVQKQQEYYKNITKKQSRVIDNVIAKGLDKGKPVEQIAKDIKTQVKQTTNSSALRIARTEINNAHSIAQVDTMKKAGIKTYSIINSPEYIGKDGKKYPCAICRKVQGPKGREYKYSVQNAGDRNNPIIPHHTHPNCNCTIVAN